MKLYFSEVEKRVARLSMDVLGPDSLHFVSKWLRRRLDRRLPALLRGLHRRRNVGNPAQHHWRSRPAHPALGWRGGFGPRA